jgi:hypothetical protein
VAVAQGVQLGLCHGVHAFFLISIRARGAQAYPNSVEVMCGVIGGAGGDDVWREATSEEPTVPPSPSHITPINF